MLLKKNFLLSLLFFGLISREVFSQELARLDSFKLEEISSSKETLHLYLTENCSVCLEQVKILKDCLPLDKISAYMEGPHEERLRLFVRRKKIPFKTFLLTPGVKSQFGFGSKSPSLSLWKEGKFKNLEGLRGCQEIKKEFTPNKV